MFDLVEKEYFHSIIDSSNVTIFSYGAINSGKTFT